MMLRQRVVAATASRSLVVEPETTKVSVEVECASTAIA